MSGRIFVSYARPERIRANTYATWLEEAGFEVWLDWREVSEGADWKECAREGIARCDLFVGVASTNYFESEGFRYELPVAVSFDRRTLAVWDGTPNNADADRDGFASTTQVVSLDDEAEKVRFCSRIAALVDPNR